MRTPFGPRNAPSNIELDPGIRYVAHGRAREERDLSDQELICGLFEALNKMPPEWLAAIAGGVSAVMAALRLKAGGPVALVAGVITGIAFALLHLYDSNQKVRDAVNGFVQDLQTRFGPMIDESPALASSTPTPTQTPTLLDAEQLLDDYHATPWMWEAFEEPPADRGRDRSSTISILVKRCLEKGMTTDEAFIVLTHAACNKWPEHPHRLWEDILRIAKKIS